MSVNVPVLAFRSSTGIILSRGPPSYDPVTAFPTVTSKNCKVMLFSPNGKFFAWFDGFKIIITSVSSWKIVQEIEKPKTKCLSLSPKGTYLCSWESFNSNNPKGTPNLFVWKTETKELIHSYIHTNQINWQPQFSKDEKICARCLDGQVLIYDKANFETPAYKIHSPKVEEFSLSPGYVIHVFCYMPGSSGPSFGKLFKYPKFQPENCVAYKTFFKADKVEIHWNNKGTNVLLLISTEVDKNGTSCYSKQLLYLLSTKGDTATVLYKKGPFHSIGWNPSRDEFCVIYGLIPVKAALFNTNCKVIFNFGSGPRSSIHYNPQKNNILFLLGFGILGFRNNTSYVEIWDTENKSIVAELDCSNTTLLKWSPDGTYFVTATTAPQVENGFKIFHFTGVLLYERRWDRTEELFEVTWQTQFHSALSCHPVQGIKRSKITENNFTAETCTSSKDAKKERRNNKRKAKLPSLNGDIESNQKQSKIEIGQVDWINVDGLILDLYVNNVLSSYDIDHYFHNFSDSKFFQIFIQNNLKNEREMSPSNRLAWENGCYVAKVEVACSLLQRKDITCSEVAEFTGLPLKEVEFILTCC